MDNTIIQQGRFTSDGTAQVIQVRSDIDWMSVYNFTKATTAGGSEGVRYYWQRGLADNDGFAWVRNAGGTADLITTAVTLGVDGFSLQNSSDQSPAAAIAVTSTTNATQPVVATGTTTGLSTGSVVRLISITSAGNLSGIDFEIDTVVGSTSFRVRRALANAPGAGTTGFYRRIPFPSIYYPRRRFVVNITQAGSAVVTTSVIHDFTVGQKVRMIVPSAFGMVEMDGLQATVTAISTANSTVTLDVDSSAFTAFAFPLNAAVPFNWAQIVPVGEDIATARAGGVSELADATLNQAYLGMSLGAGATSPAGESSDVVYWCAGKSFSVSNS